MQNALKHGAKSINEYKEEEQKFGGSGFKLGNTNNQSVYVPPKQDTGRVKKILSFYKGGIFTVDNGEPRNISDEKNEEFMDQINRGEIPYEFSQEYPGREIHVEMIDKKHEEYKEPPKPKVQPFSGSGQSLGNNTNNNNTNLDLIQGIEPHEIVLDNSQKTTSIRVTLHDGSKLIVKLNTTHTIRDLYCHIMAKKPGNRDFQLRLTFPVQTLTNLDRTIAEENLMNSSISQFLV